MRAEQDFPPQAVIDGAMIIRKFDVITVEYRQDLLMKYEGIAALLYSRVDFVLIALSHEMLDSIEEFTVISCLNTEVRQSERRRILPLD
jgi:hypothetical protein